MKTCLTSWQRPFQNIVPFAGWCPPMNRNIAFFYRSRARRSRNARLAFGAPGGVVADGARLAGVCALLLATAQNIAAQTPNRQLAKEVPVEPVRQVVRGRVAAIVDGDTLHLAAGTVTRVVRLAGIDAPEKGQPFGNAAAQVLSLRLFQKEVDVLVVGVAANRAILGIVYYEGCQHGPRPGRNRLARRGARPVCWPRPSKTRTAARSLGGKEPDRTLTWREIGRGASPYRILRSSRPWLPRRRASSGRKTIRACSRPRRPRKPTRRRNRRTPSAAHAG